MTTTGPTRVGVTGALGFIGATVRARYQDAGVEVVGVDLTEGLGVVAGDVSQPGSWQDAFVGCDLIVHTAAMLDNVSPRDRHWEVTVLGTRHVLDAAQRASVRRIVHLSSVRAFSDLDFPDGVDERHPVRPDGHRYVDTKVAAEQVVLQAHAAGEVDATIIRPGDVYGPGSKPWTLWPILALQSKGFPLPAQRGFVFSPVFVDNLVDAILLAAAAPAATGQVFTISDGIGIDNLDFFGHYARMLGVDLDDCTIADADRVLPPPGEDVEEFDYLRRTGTYSIAKAQAMLGYEPRVGLDEGMARTEAWLRASGLLPPTPTD